MLTSSSCSNLKKAWSSYLRGVQATPSSHGCLLNIGIAASFTIEPILPYLGGSLLEKDFHPSFSIASYNQIHQVCFNYSTMFSDADPNVIILLWRIEDLSPSVVERVDNSYSDLLEKMIDGLLNAVEILRAQFDGEIIISVPPYPSNSVFSTHDLDQSTELILLYRRLVSRWIDGIKRIKHIRMLDLDNLLSQSGYNNCLDIRKWYLYKQPYTEDFYLKVAKQMTRIIASQKRSPKKCIVLDCDNTLWGGIVGEDGLKGIQLGQDFPGVVYRDFQSYLLQLSHKGIFLAVASKNNEGDVLEVFDFHDAMVLKREQIAVFEVHWEDKISSLKRIAEELNIGVDSLVFVDDSAKEIAEVKERLPDVTCFMVPAEIVELPKLLQETELFDIGSVTADDLERVERMHVEKTRKLEAKTMSKQSFMESLSLEIHVFSSKVNHIARVAQLINKTNQFNLTTIRRTQAEVEQMILSDSYQVLGLEVNDRFGNYGLVGVAIVERLSESEWLIDTLLMSCRVLGRGVETAFLAKVCEAVKYSGGKKIIAEYRPTNKNSQVKDLYKEHGFLHERDNVWSMFLDEILLPPEYVKVTLDI